MNPIDALKTTLARRAFLANSSHAVGGIALASLLPGRSLSAAETATKSGRLEGVPHFRPTAKRVLCLFQSEGFSHVDLFDYKPTLTKHHGEEIPPSVKG